MQNNNRSLSGTTSIFCMINKDMDKEKDEILLYRLQSGEEKAFDRLFLRYYPSLCAYARQFVEYVDGQEIVQDVMVGYGKTVKHMLSTLL